MLALSHNEAPLFVFVIFVISIVFVFVFMFVRSQIGSAPDQQQLALSHNEGALFDPNACSTYHPINPSGDEVRFCDFFAPSAPLFFYPNACLIYHPINPSGDQAGDKIDKGSVAPARRNFLGQCILTGKPVQSKCCSYIFFLTVDKAPKFCLILKTQNSKWFADMSLQFQYI